MLCLKADGGDTSKLIITLILKSYAVWDQWSNGRAESRHEISTTYVLLIHLKTQASWYIGGSVAQIQQNISQTLLLPLSSAKPLAALLPGFDSVFTGVCEQTDEWKPITRITKNK